MASCTFYLPVKKPPRKPPENLKVGEEFEKIRLGGAFLSRPAPRYPAKAQKMNQTGWCLMEFTVAPTGETKNIKVTDCSPKGYFEEYCLNLTSTLKYKTRPIKDTKGGKSLCTMKLAKPNK